MKETKKAKKKAWDSFSKYIRTRDCLASSGCPFGGSCVTCGREYSIKDLQAGHFLSSRCNSILFEETNCHSQCRGCNLFKSGNIENYYPFMLKKYGQEEIDRLKALKKTTVKFTEQDYEDICIKYKMKLKEILST